MKMDRNEEKTTGRSEARPRQRGGIVPAPPGSFQCGKSSDGLATGLTTSPVAEPAIVRTSKESEGGEQRKEMAEPLRMLLYGRGEPREKKIED